MTTFHGSSVPRKTQGAPAHSQRNHSEREVGMVCWSKVLGIVLGYPSGVHAKPREPHFVWPGATRRCFALLRLSRRGAMRTRGERLGSVGLGVGECGWVDRVATNSCFARERGAVRGAALILL